MLVCLFVVVNANVNLNVVNVLHIQMTFNSKVFFEGAPPVNG